MTTALIPPGMEQVEADWRMSPGLVANGFVFLAGLTGQRLDGSLSSDPQAQFETAFEYAALILAQHDLTLADIVDVTSFHVGLQRHLATFRKVWNAHVSRPYPAWTAIGVSEFIIPGNLIELKVVARLPKV